MFSSLRIAVRSLSKAPAFVVITLTTLALAIGVNTSMVSLLNTLVYRAAPFSHPEQLVQIWNTSAQNPVGGFSVQQLKDLRAHTSLFESVTTYANWVNSLAVPGQTAEQLTAVNASPDFFSTFKVQPILGRAFTEDEEQAGKNNVAILSYDLWQKRFGGRRDVLGETIRLSAEPVTIIGVMPRDFQYLLLWGSVDLWRPLSLPRHLIESHESRLFQATGRLKPGVTPQQAEAQLEPLAARFAKDDPKLNAGHRFRVQPLHESVLDSTSRGFSWMLVGLSGFVLLIACANLANLQLARATGNAREFAIRSALGASRSRLIIHQLSESLLLSVAGGGLGLLVALWITDILEQQILIGNQPGLSLDLDPRVLGITLAVSLLTGVVFGVVPALLASRTDVNSTLKQQARGSSDSRSHHRIRHALIVAEIALALVLLAGASVMVRGFDRFLRMDNGWDSEHVLTATLHPPEETRYSTPEKRRELHTRLEARFSAISGVEHSALGTAVPIVFFSSVRPIAVKGQTSEVPSELPIAGYDMVTKDYFNTLQIPVLEGSVFTDDIKGDGPSVIVVNEALARHFWPGESAIGKQLNGDQQIIGVVRDVRFAGNPGKLVTPYHVYRPLVQEPWGYVQVALRSPTPHAMKRDLLRAISDVDPDISVERMGTVREVIDEMQHNFYLVRKTLEAFALLGLGLAAIGLYGVISNVVVQRTGEFGIRLALGALPQDVLSLVLRKGLQLAIIGTALGLLGSYGIVRLLSSLMPRVQGGDPVALAAVAVVLLVVAVLATWIPARRATQLDPLSALRNE